MSTVTETRTTTDGDGTRRTHTTITSTSTNIRQSASPRSLIITRTSGQLASPLSTSSTITRSYTRSVKPEDVDFSTGDYQLKTAAGVSEVKSTRDQEKKEMQDLNDRFANYIDKVRLLEAQNRKLADDLEKLKSKWGKETTQIKAMYQAELDDARHQLDDAEKEKARLEIRAASLEDQIEDLRAKLVIAQQEVALYKEKVTFQTRQLADYELEVQLLRKQLESLENDREKDRRMIEQLQDTLNRAREDLDQETLAHIDAENRRQTLQEEIEFLKSVHEQEMKELTALAYRDSSPDTRDYWKNELTQAIREIQQMYDEKVDLLRADLEASYTVKLQDMRNGAARQSIEVNKSKDDCKDLRTAITDIRDRINELDNLNNQLMREIEALRREKEERERQLELENDALRTEATQVKLELEAIMRELQKIMNSKLSLELEIAAYRKLLESEENRISRRQESSYSTTDFSSGAVGKRGEMSAKTTYQRSAKGPVTVADCPPDGASVTIENTGHKEENLDGWKVIRTVDGKERPAFVLDKRFAAFKPGTKMTIWGKGAKPSSAPVSDIEFNEPNWGVGGECVTKLVNPQGEERASLTQRTVYS